MGSNSKRPGLISLGGWGVLPRRMSVLKEGPRGLALPKDPGSRAWWDQEYCLGGGRCSRKACGGWRFPTARARHPEGKGCPGGGQCSRRACGWYEFQTARAHQLGGMGSPTQADVGAEGGPAGVSTSQGPGLTSLVGPGVLFRRRSVLKEGLRGMAVPNGPGSPS